MKWPYWREFAQCSDGLSEEAAVLAAAAKHNGSPINSGSPRSATPKRAPPPLVYTSQTATLNSPPVVTIAPTQTMSHPVDGRQVKTVLFCSCYFFVFVLFLFLFCFKFGKEGIWHLSSSFPRLCSWTLRGCFRVSAFSYIVTLLQVQGTYFPTYSITMIRSNFLKIFSLILVAQQPYDSTCYYFFLQVPSILHCSLSCLDLKVLIPVNGKVRSEQASPLSQPYKYTFPLQLFRG